MDFLSHVLIFLKTRDCPFSAWNEPHALITYSDLQCNSYRCRVSSFWLPGWARREQTDEVWQSPRSPREASSMSPVVGGVSTLLSLPRGAVWNLRSFLRVFLYQAYKVWLSCWALEFAQKWRAFAGYDVYCMSICWIHYVKSSEIYNMDFT